MFMVQIVAGVVRVVAAATGTGPVIATGKGIAMTVTETVIVAIVTEIGTGTEIATIEIVTESVTEIGTAIGIGIASGIRTVTGTGTGAAVGEIEACLRDAIAAIGVAVADGVGREAAAAAEKVIDSLGYDGDNHVFIVHYYITMLRYMRVQRLLGI